jgi:hypothetical protein
MANVITLSVNAQNDLFLDDNGNIALANNLDAVKQGCEQAVKTQLGELVLQTDIGVPYFEAVFVGVPNISAYQAAIRTAILSQPGVVQVVSLEIDQVGDDLVYKAVIETDYGTTVITNS